MKRFAGIVLLLTAGVLLAFASGKADASVYINEEYGFSFTYPEDFREVQTLFPDEVIRLAIQNDFKVPVITASVKPMTGDSVLSEIPGRVIEFMKAGMPETSGYRVIKEEKITLKNGTPAVWIEFSWILGDGVTAMETASIIAFSGGNQITMTGNTIRGLGFPVRELTEICRTLRVQ